jgi:hypothetical protein
MGPQEHIDMLLCCHVIVTHSRRSQEHVDNDDMATDMADLFGPPEHILRYAQIMLLLPSL